jgi:hypothetical protein
MSDQSVHWEGAVEVKDYSSINNDNSYQSKGGASGAEIVFFISSS